MLQRPLGTSCFTPQALHGRPFGQSKAACHSQLRPEHGRRVKSDARSQIGEINQNLGRLQIRVDTPRLMLLVPYRCQVRTAALALAPPFRGLLGRDDLPGYESDSRSRAHSRCIRAWRGSFQSSCAASGCTCVSTPVRLRTQDPKLTAGASHASEQCLILHHECEEIKFFGRKMNFVVAAP